VVRRDGREVHRAKRAIKNEIKMLGPSQESCTPGVREVAQREITCRVSLGGRFERKQLFRRKKKRQGKLHKGESPQSRWSRNPESKCRDWIEDGWKRTSACKIVRVTKDSSQRTMQRLSSAYQKEKADEKARDRSVKYIRGVEGDNQRKKSASQPCISGSIRKDELETDGIEKKSTERDSPKKP